MTEMAPGPNQVELNDPGEDKPPPPLCKRPGCDQPSVTTFGPYGRLCADHKAAVQAARNTAKPRPVKPVRRPAGGSDVVEAVLGELRAELAASQQRIDRLTVAIAALEQLDREPA